MSKRPSYEDRIMDVWLDGEYVPVRLSEVAAEADAEIAALTERVRVLEFVVQDWTDGYDRTMAEKCAEDERHCSCVPHLRKRVRVLEVALNGMQEVVQQTKGVYGWHLNGDPADWDEFEEVSIMDAALARPDGEPKGEACGEVAP